MSIATMNRMSYAALAELSAQEKQKVNTQIYQAVVVIKQASITVSIVTVSGMLRTRRTFKGGNLDSCQALFKQFNVSKIYWS